MHCDGLLSPARAGNLNKLEDCGGAAGRDRASRTSYHARVAGASKTLPARLATCVRSGGSPSSTVLLAVRLAIIQQQAPMACASFLPRGIPCGAVPCINGADGLAGPRGSRRPPAQRSGARVSNGYIFTVRKPRFIRPPPGLRCKYRPAILCFQVACL